MLLEGDRKGKQENHVLFSEDHFKYPVGVVLSISQEGVIICWAF